MSRNMPEETQNLADFDEIVAKIDAEMEEMFRSPQPSPPENFDVRLNEDQEIIFHFDQEQGPHVEIQQIVETPVLENLPGVNKKEEEVENEIKITQVQGSFRPFMVYTMDPDEPDIIVDDGTSSNEFSPPIPEPVNIPVNTTRTETEPETSQANQNQTAAVEIHDEQKKKTNQVKLKKANSQKPETAISASTLILMKVVTTNNAANNNTAEFPSPNSDKENKRKKKPGEKETPRDTNINYITPNRIFKNKNKNPSNEQIVADHQIDQDQANANVPNAVPVQGPLDFYSTNIEKAKEFNLLFKEFVKFLRSTRINTNSQNEELNQFYMLKPIYFKKLTPHRFIEEKMNTHTDKSILGIRTRIENDYQAIPKFNPPTFEAFSLTIEDCIVVREKEIREESGGKRQLRRPTESMIKAICTRLYNYMLKEMEILREEQKARILLIYKEQRARFPGGNFPLIDKETDIIDPYEFQEDEILAAHILKIPTAADSKEPEPEIPRISEKIILKKISKDSQVPESDADNNAKDPIYTPNGSRKRKSNDGDDDDNNPPNNLKSKGEYQSTTDNIVVITIE